MTDLERMIGIAEGYEMMIEKNLTLQEASDYFEIPRSTFRYHLVKFCKENNLRMPKRKAGRKTKYKQFI